MQAVFDDVDSRGDNEIERTLWRRAFEQIIRVCGVAALSDAVMSGMPTSATISVGNLQWSKAVVVACAESMMADVVANAADSDSERLQNAILQNVRKLAKNGWAKQSRVILNIKGTARSYRDVKDAVEFLCAAEKQQFRIMKGRGGQDVAEIRVMGT